MVFHEFVKQVTRPYFAVLWLLFVLVSYCYLDQAIAQYMDHLHIAALTNVAEALTLFGYGWPYLFIFAFLFLVCFVLKKRQLASRFLFLFLATVSVGVICDVLKILFGRARPNELFQHGNYGFYFLQFDSSMMSFPSGHTMMIAAVAIAMSYCLPRYFVLWFSIALLVAFSRVVLTAHYLSDVLMGLYLGTITVVMLFKIMQSMVPGLDSLKDKSYA